MDTALKVVALAVLFGWSLAGLSLAFVVLKDRFKW